MFPHPNARSRMADRSGQTKDKHITSIAPAWRPGCTQMMDTVGLKRSSWSKVSKICGPGRCRPRLDEGFPLAGWKPPNRVATAIGAALGARCRAGLLLTDDRERHQAEPGEVRLEIAPERQTGSVKALDLGGFRAMRQRQSHDCSGVTLTLPLLGESLLVPFPPLIDMLKFSG